MKQTQVPPTIRPSPSSIDSLATSRLRLGSHKGKHSLHRTTKVATRVVEALATSGLHHRTGTASNQAGCRPTRHHTLLPKPPTTPLHAEPSAFWPTNVGHPARFGRTTKPSHSDVAAKLVINCFIQATSPRQDRVPSGINTVRTEANQASAVLPSPLPRQHRCTRLHKQRRRGRTECLRASTKFAQRQTWLPPYYLAPCHSNNAAQGCTTRPPVNPVPSGYYQARTRLTRLHPTTRTSSDATALRAETKTTSGFHQGRTRLPQL